MPKAYVAACRRLRTLVRYESACFHLPGRGMGDDDTPAIREATRLYVETWVVPLIDAMESGDLHGLDTSTGRRRG